MMDWPELFERRALGMRLGLEAVAAVYERLGRPGAGRPAVHIVGTNGKGSTAAMLAHGLSRHGWRPGLFTSPHLVRVGERVRVDGVPVDDDVLLGHVHRVVAVEAAAPRPLTFFELLTLAALSVFEAEDVGVLVVEAGLGGRLDATRVVVPTATVVTSIGLEHTQWLGETLAAIAAEKAAVFTAGVPVFAAGCGPEARAVLIETAAAVGAPLSFPDPLPRAPLGLPGAHQAANAALALAAGRVVEPALEPTDFDGARWDGRLQSIAVGPGTLWLDAAHNDEAVEVLVAYFAAQPPTHIVFGCMEDKPVVPMLRRLRALGASIAWVPLGPGAAARPATLSEAYEDIARAWVDVQRRLRQGQTVLMCGSVRLVGGILALRAGEGAPDAQDPVRPAERSR
jgi:dihydrofolate synthase/folylpolyglutamate synthase